MPRATQLLSREEGCEPLMSDVLAWHQTGGAGKEMSLYLPFQLPCFLSHGGVAELSPGAPSLYSEAAAHLKKLELETVKTAGPWPALHINLNKVWGRLCLEGTAL